MSEVLPPGLHKKKAVIHSPESTQKEGLLRPPKPKSDSFLLLGSHPLGQQIEELSLTASGDAKFQPAESLGLEFQPPWC